jgi:hypothetical protein
VNGLRKLLFGETWFLPGGVAVVLLSCGLVVKPLLGDAWHDYGAVVLVVGVLALLVASIRRTA